MKHSRLTLLALLFLGNTYSSCAQWTPLEGPGTYSADFSTGRKQIFASTTDGIFRSADLGLNWDRIAGLPQHYRYGLVRIGPDSTLLVVDAYDDACSCVYLYRSTDDGFSWQRIELPGFANYVNSVCIGRGNYLLVSLTSVATSNVEYSVWESPDRGETWNRNPLQDLFEGYKYELRVFGNSIWGLTPNQLFRGTISGTDWELVADHLDTFRNVSYAVLDHTILLSSSVGWQKGHLWRSTTGGLSWYLVPGDPGLVQNIQQHQQTLVAFDGGHIIRSDDKGTGWSIQSDVPLKDSGRFLLRWPYVIAHINEVGVGRSADVGQSFTPTNERLGYASFAEKLACLDKQLFCSNPYAVTERLMRYDKEDKKWSRALFNQDVFPIMIVLNHDFFVLDGRIFYSNYLALLARSDDGGETWINCAPAQDLDASKVFGNKMFSIANSLFVFTAYQSSYSRLLKTDDYGANWEVLDPFPPGGCAFGGVTVAGQVGNTLFAGSAYGDCLYASEDLGETWNAVNLPEIPLETDTGRIYLAQLHPTGERILLTMARWEKGREDIFFFVSNDKGASWLAIKSTPLSPTRKYFELASQSLELGNHTLLASYDKGIIVSADEGLTWNTFNQGLPGTGLLDLETDGTFLYTTVSGHGVWKRPLSDLQVTNPETVAALQVNVQSNPGSGLVRLVAGEAIETARVQWFDMSGRLCSEETVEFICDQAVLELSFPSGMYVFRLSSAGRQASGKVVLVR